MANYYCAARSNYFKVKDAAAFKAWTETIIGLGVWEKEDGTFGLYDDGNDSCGWPSWMEDEEGETFELDLLTELSAHLTEDSVAVLMEAGAEKLRYVRGCANAVNSKGEIVSISLGDIYRLAFDSFGIDPTPAEY